MIAMRNIRFYSDQALAIGAQIQLSNSATAHAVRVLRMAVGDQATLFNGDGYDYACTLITVQKNAVLVVVDACQLLENESPMQITLLQGISSGDRMDYTIQKAVELGVKQIQPLTTERSIVKLTGDRAEKKVAHWQGVVNSACEQSGRAVVPTVLMPLTLKQWLLENAHQGQSRILLNPVGAKQLRDIDQPVKQVQLLIGPEGGLNDAEINLAVAHQFQSIILGPRVLRTETAALAALSAMHTLFGDF